MAKAKDQLDLEAADHRAQDRAAEEARQAAVLEAVTAHNDAEALRLAELRLRGVATFGPSPAPAKDAP